MITWSYIDSFHGNRTDSDLTFDRPCPVCGSNYRKIFFQLKNFQFYTDSSATPKRIDITQNQCCNCLTIYMNPAYTDYGFKVLFKESGASYGAPKWKYKNRASWLCDAIDFKDNHLVIDLGCHLGNLLKLLPNNLKKIGIDIDPKIIKQATLNNKEITFICNDLDKFHLDEEVNVFTMFHVLEHLVNPIKVLGNLRQQATPNTILAIEVPVLENGNQVDINSFFSVHHLTHFTTTSIRFCLQKSGWEEISFSPGNINEGCRILATPNRPVEGINNHAQHRSTVDDTLLYSYLSGYYKNLSSIHNRLNACKKYKKCMIWGGGTHLEMIYHLTPLFRIYQKMQWHIVDIDNDKQGNTWRGIPISSPDVLEGIEWDKHEVLLLVSSFGGQKSILENARRLGIPDNCILTLYDDGKQ